MKHHALRCIFRLVMCLPVFVTHPVLATTVRMQTSLGDIDIQLMDSTAPATVSNFLDYVTSGAYDYSFLHRSVPGFVIQGGGYLWNSTNNIVSSIPPNSPVANEFSPGRSNLRGTVAMAKLDNDPNSAMSQWYINLSDNSKNLDYQNGGYSVFGQVIGNGMQVVDAIAALRVINALRIPGAKAANFSEDFTSLPVFVAPTTGITEQNLVIIRSVSVLPELAGGGAVPVVEFYNTNLDHYFITANTSEAEAIDNGSAGTGWYRTGETFKSGGSASVCRFYGSQSPGPNSHFYTADPDECEQIKQVQTSTPATQKRWNFESMDFVTSAPAKGVCLSGLIPIYRAYNNGYARGMDSNHRITSSVTAIQQLESLGWINEGVVMCAPE
ncbi:MAG: peptidylprolyl isomerase [Sulfuricellaceae bacterium]|nr:peptidylprolyl isomerase [Sulfuricellaceae bacterium]